MSFRAVLFDLDGTLLDSLEDIADSVNAVLKRRDLPERPVRDYRLLVGEGVPSLVRRAFPELAAEGSIEPLVQEVREEYSRRRDAKTRPYPGVPELLDALAARGLPMAILSNKPDPFTRRVVAERLRGWAFAAVRGALPEKALKPDPACALELARGLGVPPGAFLYLGDTAVDMRTAVSAGMFPAGALWGFRDAEELTGAGARALLERPQDLLTLL